jgi:transcriptional regulator with XRE-family HTH domain
MEIVLDKVRDYLVALKNAGDFTFEDIANISGIPLPTIRNIYSGKTPDARFGTIAKIVIALGGDLNELIGYEKKKEIEINSTVSLKETYEMRIADLVKSYEERIEDIKRLQEEISILKKQYEEDTQKLESLNDYDHVVRLAREKYLMKRPNEDIFVIKTVTPSE